MHVITLKMLGWNEVVGHILTAIAQLKMTSVEF